MSDPLRWGLLSTALINRKIIKGASMSAEVTVLAVGSRDAARSVEYAREWGIPRAYGSYDALLADPDIDAVYISLPNGLHHEWTMRALAAGKHVLCEKPYSRHPAEVAAAFDEAEQRGLILSEAFMFRYNPQIQTLARLVREGQIGSLRLISAAFSWPTDAAGDVRLNPALDGGSLLDVGVYPLSVSRLLAGEPHSFTAQCVKGATDVDVTFVATLGFGGGVLAHFDSGFQLPDRSHLEVVGALGTIEVSDPWHCFAPRLLLTMQGAEPVTVPVPIANSYQLELEEFGRAVRRESHVLLGRVDAEGQARSVAALLNAAAIHATLRLP